MGVRTAYQKHCKYVVMVDIVLRNRMHIDRVSIQEFIMTY